MSRARDIADTGDNNLDDIVVDGSGRVGIGTTPSQSLHVAGEGLFEKASADSVVSVSSTGGSGRSYQIRSQTSGDFYIYDNTAGAARVIITSAGKLLLGTTSVTSGILNAVYSGTYGIDLRGASGASTLQLFFAGATNVGSISTNGTSTAFNTSSDYRLKENVVADWDATTRLKQLNPVRFNFIADPDTTVDGFLAHEVQDVVPEAISGTKDAMRDEEYEVTPAVLDEDGNVVTPAVMGTRSVPDYQGIDQSKLVPLLVKTIQELEARIAALENA